MMKNKLLSVVLIMMLAIAGSAFAGGEQEKAVEEEASIKVAILLPGSINDQGWNTMAYLAMKTVEKELGAEIAFTEQTPASDFEEIFRGYSIGGYDLIMGHGFQFGDAAKKVAKDFTDKYFIVTSTNIFQEPNLGSFRINDPQSGFVQGYIAALLTKTNKVGSIGGMEIPPVINQQKGFMAGAKYCNPDVEVVTAFTGDFYDVAKAKEMAKAMYHEGMDIIVADVDKASLGITEAARELGFLVIGSSGDLGKENSDVVITSLFEDFSKVFVILVGRIIQGEFEAKPYEMGVQDGVVRLAPLRAGDVSSKDREKIDQLMKDLKNDKINLDKYLVY